MSSEAIVLLALLGALLVVIFVVVLVRGNRQGRVGLKGPMGMQVEADIGRPDPGIQLEDVSVKKTGNLESEGPVKVTKGNFGEDLNITSRGR